MGTNHTGRRSVALTAAVVLAGLGLVACSDDEAPAPVSPTSSSSAPADTVTDDGGEGDNDGAMVTAFNDVQTCEVVDGTATAAGELENTGELTADFALEVEFGDTASGSVLGSGTTSIDTLAPGDIGPWTVTMDGVDDGEISCTTVTLEGTPVG